MQILDVVLFNLMLFQNNPSQVPLFISPLDIPIFLSGNFGELRIDHFHSGIDIRTQGVIGKKVYSVEQGYISRIKIQNGGYGNSVYINHPGGFTSQYGHLDSFNEKIDSYIKDVQYKKMSYTVDVYPEKDALPVSKGDLIARSGNSGSSNGPHLHFEIRKSGSQIPLNPLKYGFAIKDNTPPRISGLFVYPSIEGTGSRISPIEYKVKKENGIYTPALPEAIKITGEGGFGVETFDYLDYNSNHCGIYTIELSVNKNVIYLFRADEFSFDESRYVNAHTDYDKEISENRKVHLLFRKPNNKLSMYPVMVNNGRYNFKAGGNYLVNIKVTDAAGNECNLEFIVEGGSESNLTDGHIKASEQLFSYKSNNYFENSSVRLEIPKGALYDDMAFEYARTDSKPGIYPSIHFIGSKLIPLHISSSLSINGNAIPEALRSKTIIVKMEDKDKSSFLEGKWQGDWINTRILNFGKYTLEVDTIPPQITAINIKPGIQMAGQPEIRFAVNDKLSGIKEFNGFIDNKWVLFEYDEKNNMIYYKFDNKRLSAGTNHVLMFYVKDVVGNKSAYQANFTW